MWQKGDDLRVVQIYEEWLSGPQCELCSRRWQRGPKALPVMAAALVVNDADTGGKSLDLCLEHCTRLGLKLPPLKPGAPRYFGRDVRRLLSDAQRRAVEEVPLEAMRAELGRGIAIAACVRRRKQVTSARRAVIGRVKRKR